MYGYLNVFSAYAVSVKMLCLFGVVCFVVVCRDFVGFEFGSVVV